VNKVWANLPDTAKTIISVVLTIVLIALVYYAFKKVKDSVEKKELDEYKGSSSFSPTDYSGDNTTSNSNVRDPRPLIDKIFTKLDGPNLYVYPEIVNLLTNLSKEELTIGYNYFEEEYGHVYNESLTEFINNETDGGVYEPAISKLENYNLH